MNFAQRIRWSDNDRYWGPFTYARERGTERGITIMLGSGDGDDYPGCRYSGYCTVTVDCEGDIVGANSYAQHYFDNKVPMARVDGLDDLQLVMRSI